MDVMKAGKIQTVDAHYEHGQWGVPLANYAIISIVASVNSVTRLTDVHSPHVKRFNDDPDQGLKCGSRENIPGFVPSDVP
jgi:hypothetical protein